MDGIINIYKEAGYTSHDVVAVVRRILHQKKVGHTGTLDPAAQGVLPICIGRGTKLADYIMAEKKGYRAMITLGITTDTQDAEGNVLESMPVDFDTERIQEVVSTFVGEIWQTPPMYSAIKIQGKKLYELARQGKEVERPKRHVTIHSIDILRFMPPNQFEMDVVCSKGTYIRSLAADIGQALGCGGHMHHLLRTMSGRFTLETAITLEQLQNLADADRLADAVMPMDKALCELNRVWIHQKASKRLYNGGKIYSGYFVKSDRLLTVGERVLAYDSLQELTGIYEVAQEAEGGQVFIKPLTMLRTV